MADNLFPGLLYVGLWIMADTGGLVLNLGRPECSFLGPGAWNGPGLDAGPGTIKDGMVPSTVLSTSTGSTPPLGAGMPPQLGYNRRAGVAARGDPGPLLYAVVTSPGRARAPLV